MDKLVSKLVAKVASGSPATEADCRRLKAYNDKHPMWMVFASRETINAYNEFVATL